MPTLTIYTDKKFNSSRYCNPAVFGHFWYVVEHEDGIREAFGFGPTAEHAGQRIALGDFKQHGDAREIAVGQSGSFPITMQQLFALFVFGKMPEAYGFHRQFNALTNNSLDFVVAALRHIGINLPVPRPANDGGLTQESAFAAYLAGEEDTTTAEFRKLKAIAIDLAGDGLSTSSVYASNATLFQRLNGTYATRHATGWLGPSDGWLIWDRNSNGSVDSGLELVSAQDPDSRDKYDKPAQIDELDSNGDGRIDAQDANFAQLRIWRDLDSDGRSMPWELKSLADHNIAAIDLSPTVQKKILHLGNTSEATYTVERSDGSTTQAHFVRMHTDGFRRQFLGFIPLSDQAKALPDVRGGGRVRNLAEAITLTPKLGMLVRQYMKCSTRAQQIPLLAGILKAWSETAPSTFFGMGYSYRFEGVHYTKNFDMRDRLRVIEPFMDFTIEGGGPNFSGLSAGFIKVSISAAQTACIQATYDNFMLDLDRTLCLASRLKPYVDRFWEGRPGKGGFAALEAAFESRMSAQRSDGLADLVDFIASIGAERLAAMGWDGQVFLHAKLSQAVDHIRSSGTLDSVAEAMHAGKTQSSTASAPLHFPLSIAQAEGGRLDGRAGKGKQILLGMAGEDVIFGGDFDDVLDGGAGNDAMTGGRGNDVYRFGRGYGIDAVVQDRKEGEFDVIQMLGDIASDQIWLSRKEEGLVLSLLGSGEFLAIDKWFEGDAHRVNEIRLADGKRLTESRVDQLVDAMAAFSPPPADATSLPQDYRQALAPVLAASWV